MCSCRQEGEQRRFLCSASVEVVLQPVLGDVRVSLKLVCAKEATCTAKYSTVTTLPKLISKAQVSDREKCELDCLQKTGVFEPRDSFLWLKYCCCTNFSELSEELLNVQCRSPNVNEESTWSLLYWCYLHWEWWPHLEVCLKRLVHNTPESKKGTSPPPCCTSRRLSLPCAD